MLVLTGVCCTPHRGRGWAFCVAVPSAAPGGMC